MKRLMCLLKTKTRVMAKSTFVEQEKKEQTT